jgi:penicillin-binding protein 1A
MLNLLQSVVQGGTGSRLRDRYNLMNDIGGKTGTSQNHSDGWFMGVTPDLVAGTWVGGEDRSIHFEYLDEGQAAATALPIFGLFMQKVYADKNINLTQGPFERPASFNVDMNCPVSDIEKQSEAEKEEEY